MGDPLRYRTKDELEKWREDDPIGILECNIFESDAADRVASSPRYPGRIGTMTAECNRSETLSTPALGWVDLYVCRPF